jgi:hypothetical protein
MIRENLECVPSQIDPEAITDDPRVQYNMGKSEKFAVHIPNFLRRNEGDPAIKVNISLFSPRTPANVYLHRAELFVEVERTPSSPCSSGTSPGG